MYSAADFIGQLAERLERNHESAFQSGMAEIIKNVEAVNKLNEAGFDIKLDQYNAQYVVIKDMTPEQLVKARRVLGCDLRQSGIEPYGGDARKRLMRVKLSPVNYPDIHLSYIRKADKQGKCKVKRVKSDYLTVVCDNS